MTNRSTASSIDDYIAEFPPETQEVLKELRSLIKASAPDATETISYAIPTFDLKGKHLVHFAGFKNHIGFYPTASGIDAFMEELKTYKSGRGSVQFPLAKPLPRDLISRMVEFRVQENRKASKVELLERWSGRLRRLEPTFERISLPTGRDSRPVVGF
jgi:uncharacterized protein YdhG (YjbR/CyaY superfamily)